MAATGPWPSGPPARFLDAEPAMHGGSATPEHPVGGGQPGGAPDTPYATPLWATPAQSASSGPRTTGSPDTMAPDTMASLRHAYHDLESAITEQVR